MELVRPADVEHASRLILMASYLYYWCDSPVITDANFDRLCNYAANNWNQLPLLRRYQLGSADDIRATGSHVLMSIAAEGGARMWYSSIHLQTPEKETLPAKSWKFNKRLNLHLAPLV